MEAIFRGKHPDSQHSKHREFIPKPQVCRSWYADSGDARGASLVEVFVGVPARAVVLGQLSQPAHGGRSFTAFWNHQVLVPVLISTVLSSPEWCMDGVT